MRPPDIVKLAAVVHDYDVSPLKSKRNRYIRSSAKHRVPVQYKNVRLARTYTYCNEPDRSYKLINAVGDGVLRRTRR